VTNPLQAEPGTICGDFGIEVGWNVVHGSDSPENGEREIGKTSILAAPPAELAVVYLL
jgi:nucleoside diphosphate kinase